MGRLAVLLCLMVLLQLGSLLNVSADTIEHVSNIGLTTTNWVSSVTVPKFDPALGELKSITFVLKAHVESAVKFESLDAAPATVTTTVSGSITLQRPDMSNILTVLPFSQQVENVSTFDGTIDFGGTSGRTYPQVSADNSGSITSPPPVSDLALFTGSGEITLPVVATAVAAVSGPGNVIQQINTSASAEIKVIYEYATSGLFQAYAITGGSANVVDGGYAGPSPSVSQAVPGVLSIDPGGEKWPNFVTAARVGVDYYIKNVVLRKTIGEVGQCYDVFSEIPGYPAFNQQGTNKIRLRWPLMYEPPGTTWTLTITSGTQNAVQLPGESKPEYLHQDVWEWRVEASFESMKNLIKMVRQLPYGLCEVPLISNRLLYEQLLAQIDKVQAAVAANDLNLAAEELIEFELLVLDNCESICPPNAAGTYVGIVNTLENPVCCKLIADAEYVAKRAGIFHDGR